MSNIRYVCLSDTHLGEEDSLLTNLTASGDIDTKHPSPVMVQLVECLRDLISRANDDGVRPMLVLGGDIAELALALTNQSAMVFERFIELTMPEGGELFDRIVYIPGNHDHHFWEVAREAQYANYIAQFEPGSDLEVPWHTTNMFVEDVLDPVPAHLLTKLIQRFPHLRDFFIAVAYPNLAVLRGDNQEKCVIFHHGHFIEEMYQLMSRLRKLLFPDREMPKVTWDIEAENFAWIDFFWSAMGRSGAVGQEVETIYERLGDQEAREELIDSVASDLAETHNIPRIPEWLEDDVIRYALTKTIGRAYGERRDTVHVIGPDTEKGLRSYVEGPLREQILAERDNVIPPDVTFIFGHTHKPFQQDMRFQGYQGWVDVYNTGGWIVESVEREPKRGGALVLVDEELDATSLRMYNEADEPEQYSVKVEQSMRPGKQSNPFHERIVELVDQSGDLWGEFSRVVADEVSIRARYLQNRLDTRRRE